MNLLNKKDYRPGNANFESYFLDFSRNIIQVKPTKKLLFFYGIFALIGLFFMLVPCFAQKDSDEAVWAILIFGIIFFIIGERGIASARRRNYPLLDFNENIFYPQGRPRSIQQENTLAIPIKEIEKICISSRIVRGNESSYRSYTLSLQCTGNREVILLKHGSLKAFMRDARLLSKQLDLPLMEDDLEAKIRAAQVKGAPVLLIFSFLWLGISFFALSKFWHEQDMFSKIILGIFIFIGVIMLFNAIKLMSQRKK